MPGRPGCRSASAAPRRPSCRDRRRSWAAPAGTCRSSAGPARPARRGPAPVATAPVRSTGRLRWSRSAAGASSRRTLRNVCMRQVLLRARRRVVGIVPVVSVATERLPCRACSSRAWRRSRPRSSPRCPRSPCAPGRSTSGRASRTPTARPRCWPTSPRTSPAASTSTRPASGVPALRTAVAEHQKRFWGLDVDPDTVLVTTGATEAIAVRGARAVRAGRRGRHLPALLRLLRRDDRALRRRRCGPSRCGRRTSPSTRTSCAPRSRPARGWCWSTPRTTRPARCSPASS